MDDLQRFIEFLTILSEGFICQIDNVDYVMLEDNSIAIPAERISNGVKDEVYLNVDYNCNNFTSLVSKHCKYLKETNIFELLPLLAPTKHHYAIAVTTNGNVNSSGEAIMGKGFALQIKQRFPQVPKVLGTYLTKYGNRCFNLGRYILCQGLDVSIISFPTKHNWKDDSDLTLISKSCEQATEILTKFNIDSCFVSYPGISNGNLSPSLVKPVLDLTLDKRFYICSL